MDFVANISSGRYVATASAWSDRVGVGLGDQQPSTPVLQNRLSVVESAMDTLVRLEAEPARPITDAKMDARKISVGAELMEDRNANASDVCDALGISRDTLYRHLQRKAGK